MRNSSHFVKPLCVNKPVKLLQAWYVQSLSPQEAGTSQVSNIKPRLLKVSDFLMKDMLVQAKAA